MSRRNECFGCTDRHIGCHGDCERYKEFVDENEEFKKKVRTSREIVNYRGENIRNRLNREAVKGRSNH